MKKAVLQRSELIYEFLLKLYPEKYRKEFGEEMKYIFSETLKDAYKESGYEGVIKLWGRTILDTAKSVVSEQKESMKAKRKEILKDNKVFLWIAFITIALLVIPFVMTIHDGGIEGQGWNWTGRDYLFGFIMIFGFSSLFVLTARNIQKKKDRIATAIAFAVAFLYIWAEFAVGVFTNLGS